MIAASPEIGECVNAVMLRADWRPLVGLGPDDAGTWLERIIAGVVIEKSVEKHNADVKRANR
jgi:hypothetical protein